CQNAYNIVLQKFYWPEGKSEQRVQFFVNPINFAPGYQLVEFNYSSPIPLGNDVMVRCNIYLDIGTKNTKNWSLLFPINEEFCKFTDKYLRQFFYDMETAVGIIPKSCPIPKGTYHALNYTMNFRTLKLQTFPFGDMKLTVSGVTKHSRKELWSYVVLLSNKQN
ncbi:hypothetical protein ILUMI_18895, partial [Ignelater luminosus]